MLFIYYNYGTCFFGAHSVTGCNANVSQPPLRVRFPTLCWALAALWLLSLTDRAFANESLLSERQTHTLLSSEQPGLTLELHLVSPHNQRNDDLGPGWQTNFGWHLGAAGNQWVITEPDGTTHTIEPPSSQSTANKTAINKNASERVINFRWQDDTNWRHRFRGSYLVTQTSPDGFQYRMKYRDRRLESVTLNDPRGITSNPGDVADKLYFFYTDNRLHKVTNNRGEVVTLHYSGQGILKRVSGENTLTVETPTGLLQACLVEPISPNENCNSADAAPPADFHLRMGVPGATRLDIRPASCRSFFTDYSSIERGRRIENGFEQHANYIGLQSTNRIFPIVDFIRGREAVVVVSRDLTSASYQQPRAIYQLIMREAENIDQRFIQPLAIQGNISATERGSTSIISNDQIDSVAMEVVIQYGTATADQIAQIQQAVLQAFLRYGIQVRIIEIP